MSLSDPFIVGLLKAIAGFWPLVLVIGAVAWIYMTGTSFLSLILHGAKALAEFALSMGVRTFAFAGLCLFGLLVLFVFKNVTSAPNIASYFSFTPAGNTTVTATPVPNAGSRIIYQDWPV